MTIVRLLILQHAGPPVRTSAPVSLSLSLLRRRFLWGTNVRSFRILIKRSWEKLLRAHSTRIRRRDAAGRWHLDDVRTANAGLTYSCGLFFFCASSNRYRSGFCLFSVSTLRAVINVMCNPTTSLGNCCLLDKATRLVSRPSAKIKRIFYWPYLLLYLIECWRRICRHPRTFFFGDASKMTFAIGVRDSLFRILHKIRYKWMIGITFKCKNYLYGLFYSSAYRELNDR